MTTPETAAALRAHLRDRGATPPRRVVEQAAALLGGGEVVHVDSDLTPEGCGRLVALTASRVASVHVTRTDGHLSVRATGFARSSLTTLTTSSEVPLDDGTDHSTDDGATDGTDAAWPSGQTLTATYWEVAEPVVLPLASPVAPAVAETTQRLFTSLLADLSDH